MPHCHEDDAVSDSHEGHAQDAHAHDVEPVAPGPRWKVGGWRQFLLVLLVLAAVLGAASLAAFSRRPATPPTTELAPGATIFYNEACSDCATYLRDELLPSLEAAGASPIVVKDYINNPAYREELRGVNDRYGVPFTLQSHLATFVRDDRLAAFEGHVPGALIRETLALPDPTARLLLYQDSMGAVSTYRAWAFAGDPQEYAVTVPVTTYLAWFAANVAPAPGATIYYEALSPDCAAYVDTVLRPALEAAGVAPIAVRDSGSDPAIRQEMDSLHTAFQVPPNLRDHMAAFVNVGNLSLLRAFEGHVGAALLQEALAPGSGMDRVLVHEDAMGGATQYHAWAFVGEAPAFTLGTPLTAFEAWFAGTSVATPSAGPLLPLVLATGFVDGLNPCAFAVLLFFVSLLYVTRRPRIELARIGALYIFAVFLAYFLIGLGLIAAIMISSDPHLIARVSGVVVAGLGVFTLVQPHLPGVPNPFHTPGFAWARIKAWMFKGTQPAATVSGFLVGLCTFPCSGGIYVATLSLLAARTTYWEGLGYLYLYNLAFVLPLVLILVAVSNKSLARTATAWERKHTDWIRQGAGVAMIVVGLATAIFV